MESVGVSLGKRLNEAMSVWSCWLGNSGKRVFGWRQATWALTTLESDAMEVYKAFWQT